ncbi:MAG TPA: SulP family inorganic anion transporter [Xanthobacteraceae bacterium]|nr:SulP family inorganic anion transporter [Xanthobacteraceae bacterium]
MRGTEHGRDGALTAWSRLIAMGRDAGKDALAGLVAAVVLIANIVSFGALMFPGDLSAGIPVAIWSMLIGGCVAGAWIALSTSLPPLATGIDSPTGAVLVLLSALTAAGVRAAGGSTDAAIQSVMLIFTAATFLSGALLYGLGALRWGSYFRFVPYPVVGGFLAATGYFLIVGAIRMVTGRTALTFGGLADWTGAESAKLASAVAALGILLALRRWVKSAFALPAALIAMWLVSVAALRALGLSGSEHGWYFRSLGTLTAWLPFHAVRPSHLTWSMLLQLVPQLLAVTIVALISLVTKVSSIEVGRQASGDLDQEFRGHGIGSLVAAPLGGLTSSLQVGTSRLLEHAGGATRMSGVACALALGLVGLANLDLPGLIPIPIVAGLVLYLGYTFIVDALWRPYAQRAWLDLTLAVAIMIVCIGYGYLIGVLAGLMCACLLFVISYARLGVVRRHLTRAQFSSHVDRSAEASEHLRAVGDAVQLYWLSGYIFFGSSEGLFERIRDDIEAALPRRVAYVILDCAMVSGADSSAFVSLAKLRNYCNQHGTTIVFSSLAPAVRDGLARGGFIGGKSRHQAFADVHAAVAWCEDKLLAEAGKVDSDFASWLQGQLGANVKSDDLIAYLERKELDGSTVLHRQGEAADSIDLVAAGQLAIDVATRSGENLRVRRIATHTVVGEMGFFRRSLRSATVSSEGPTVLFTLTRANFERMRRERPDLASAFDDFVIRMLANRIDIRDREVAALESVTS